MQDGIPCHQSYSTISYLEKRCKILKGWPANSPDLNPIENLWGIMGKTLGRRRPSNTRELENVVRDIWNNLEWDLIQALINSMERRLRLVIEYQGENINGFFWINRNV